MLYHPSRPVTGKVSWYLTWLVMDFDSDNINQQHKTKQHAHNNSAWSLLDSPRKKSFTGLFFFSKWCMTRFSESAVKTFFTGFQINKYEGIP